MRQTLTRRPDDLLALDPQPLLHRHKRLREAGETAAGEVNELAEVKRAVEAKRSAEEGYRASLAAAVARLQAAGDKQPYATVANAAGVSRQAVRELVKRHAGDTDTTSDEARMRARLAELDAAYERAIDRMTDRAGDYKRITAWQNAQAGKRRRKGLPPLTPVSVQLRDYAESRALKVLEDFPDDPRVKRIIADLDEAATLRKTLQAIDDSRLAF